MNLITVFTEIISPMIAVLIFVLISQTRKVISGLISATINVL